MKRAAFAIIFLSSVTHASPKFDGFETFGSGRVTEAMMRAKFGKRLDALASIPPNDLDNFSRINHQLEGDIKSAFDLAFVELSVVTYFQPHPGRYATLDMVDGKDAKEKLPFRAEPKGSYPDPDGVLALWNEYQGKAFKMQFAGHFEYPKKCPAWHCAFGFENPELAPYLDRINAGAQKHEELLAQILKDDQHAQRRADAAFLLAHIKDGTAVVRYMYTAIDDPSPMVRNNALRVLFAIAHDHPELPMDAGPIVLALHYPTTTDRNKAGWILAYLSAKDELKPPILNGDGWLLLDMLKLKQPNNHDPAYTTLKNLSGLKYGERDYSAWEKWIRSKIGPRANI